jgi:ATP-binding cassette subfamily C (CFTR/MRP) protein 1
VAVVAVALRNASFSWAAAVGSAEQQLCLRGIDVELPRGKLTAVVGPVGAGKSSLLAALLGELELVQLSGKPRAAVEWRGLAPQRAVAYVAQSPFLLQASVRENILLQHAYVRDRYAAVVAACGMQRDIGAI